MSAAPGHVGEGLDTALARHLDRSGRVGREELLRALGEVRAGRGENPSLSLGVYLLERGVLSAGELDGALAELGVEPGASEERASAPQQIGPYRVLRVLGAGGMGKVFAVEHTGTGRREALKTVGVDLDPAEAERFRREAEVLASLDHPGLIRIYGGRFESQQPYLTLELCEGGSLQARLREGPLDSAAVLALAEALGPALSYLHARGVLHRDLKPDNVLFDSRGSPKLTDFGLARVRGTQGLTQTGEILGTPAFMAPEQAGRAHEADARCDVYGLAATLYAAATGQPPFSGGGLFEILGKVLEEAPPPPRALGVELPPALEAGIMAGLAKDPAERPASVAALVDSLRTGAAPPRPPRRASFAAAGAAGASLLLIAGATWGLMRAPPRPAPTPARPQPAPSLPLQDLPPARLWARLAGERQPLSPAVMAHVWSSALTEPPPLALEDALVRCGHEERALVAYLRLRRGAPLGSAERAILPYADLDRRREELAGEYLSRDSIRLEDPSRAMEELKTRLRSLTKDYLARIERSPLPKPLLEHYLGRYQHTYLQARQVLKFLVLKYGEGEEELKSLKDVAGDRFVGVGANLAYYFSVFNPDRPTRGAEGIPAGAVLPEDGTLDRLAAALYRIVFAPDEEVATQQAEWLAAEAAILGPLTKDLAPRAYLTLQRRLLAQAMREGRPELLTAARDAGESSRTHDPFELRRLRNAIVLAFYGGQRSQIRQALQRYDRERKVLTAERYSSFDQARELFAGQLLIMEGKYAEALERVRGARVGDEAFQVETLALEAHAMKLQGDPDYARFLSEFERKSGQPWHLTTGLEWYLHDARGVIEGEAWWPGQGAFGESR